MAASHFKADNLLAFVDRNRLQQGDLTSSIMDLESLADKWRSFGWAVREIDGHDVEAIVDAIEAFPFEPGKPSIIIARTVKGKGLPVAEDQASWHYHNVDDELVKKAVAILQKGESRGEA